MHAGNQVRKKNNFFQNIQKQGITGLEKRIVIVNYELWSQSQDLGSMHSNTDQEEVIQPEIFCSKYQWVVLSKESKLKLLQKAKVFNDQKETAVEL